MNYFILILIAIAGVVSGVYFGRRKRDLSEKTNKAILTCPKCNHKQEMEIPKDKCLPFYRCENCQEVISVPKDSTNCCVICEYSDKSCPVAR